MIIGLENSRNNLTCCCVCAEGCYEAKHCCPTVKLFCFWCHDEVREVYVNKCKSIVKLRKVPEVRLASWNSNSGTTDTKNLVKAVNLTTQARNQAVKIFTYKRNWLIKRCDTSGKYLINVAFCYQVSIVKKVNFFSF